MALADYAARYTFGRSAAFTNRVQMVCIKTALKVLAPETPVPANAVFRTRLARQVLADPTVLATNMALAVLMNNFGFDDTSTDAGLQTEVDALWDKFANPAGA